ncbi:MAG: FKBP-type peptidyl-prolyl cis-trans isomerase N-terminal domain-containing protein [Verrucomicrobiales bacterium]
MLLLLCVRAHSADETANSPPQVPLEKPDKSELSYASGVQLAQGVKRSAKEIDPDEFMAGFEDAIAEKRGDSYARGLQIGRIYLDGRNALDLKQFEK